jgi:hypothetical protein
MTKNKLGILGAGEAGAAIVRLFEGKFEVLIKGFKKR